MKSKRNVTRREFVAASALGAAGFGLAGCSVISSTVEVKNELTPIDFEKKVPKPKGTMPTAELGSTGIRVSRFGFGSHIREEIKAFAKEREWMIREAYDLGVNFFDIYDLENNCFQYEPTSRYLAPMINDVVISLTLSPYDGRTLEQEIERDLRVFGRDYIDLVRIHAWNRDEKYPYQLGHKWEWWEKLFRFKEKGYIRAVGIPVHYREDLKQPLAELPLDFVILPYNFYHNWLWSPLEPDTKMHTVIPELRKRGIGVIIMKPFAGDNLVMPFIRLTARYDESGEVNYAKACLRYIINSGLEPDSTIAGMFNPYHLYENVDAFYHPAMNDQEREILKKISKQAKVVAQWCLPDHYRFLHEWVPDDISGERVEYG